MEDLELIKARIENLRNAIAFSRCENRVMNVGEGILCNQEIAAWYSVLGQITEQPRYVVSDEIHQKVKKINTMIEKKNWKRPIELYEL